MSHDITEPASWVIRNKRTGTVVTETFNVEIARRINTAIYEAVPILTYLQEVNRAAKAATAACTAKQEISP